MKKTIRFIAMFLATLMVLTTFTFIALAEGESSVADSSVPSDESSNPGGESSDPGDESSDPGDESSDPGSESSDPSSESSDPGSESSDPSSESSDPSSESSDPSSESSNPGDDPKPEKYTIRVICSEPNGLSQVLVGGTAVSAGGSVSLSGEVSINVSAKEGYNISRAVLMVADETVGELDCTAHGTAEATFPGLTNGVTYTLEINLVPIQTPTATEITVSVDDNHKGEFSGFDIFVNGTAQAAGISALTVNSGDSVTLNFKTPKAFQAKRALLYNNGTYVSSQINGSSYTFTATGEKVDIKLYYYYAPVRFTMNGPSTFRLYYYDGREIATITNTTSGRMDKIEYLEIYDRNEGETNVPCYSFKSYVVEGGAYELSSTVISGTSDHWKIGPARYFMVDGLITVTQNVKEVEVPVAPTEHTITIVVGEGGSAAAVQQSNNKTHQLKNGVNTIKLLAGDSLKFTFTTNEGYVIDTVYNNDESVSLENGNEYSVVGIIKDHRIEIKFISEEDLLASGIGKDDVDWDAKDIVINVTAETPVLPEVFEHIETLKGEGKFVEFRSKNGSIFVPYGKESFVGASTNMAVGVLPDPAGLDDLLATGANRKVFSVSAGAILPEGTTISVNLGKEFKNQNIALYEYKTSSLSQKNVQRVDADGVSGRYTYNNEATLVFAKVQYEVEVTSNGGGKVTPFGNFLCEQGSNLKIELKASEGYIISGILLNGAVYEIDEGISEYSLRMVVEKDYAVDIKFELKAAGSTSQDPAESQTSKDEKDDNDQGGSNLIPILVIAFVAVAGAAALFVVKWKQEKF